MGVSYHNLGSEMNFLGSEESSLMVLIILPLLHVSKIRGLAHNPVGKIVC